MPLQFPRRTALWLKLTGMRLHANGGNRLLSLSFVACSSFLAACGFLPQPHVAPIPALQDRLSPEHRARRLIVMLPGIYDKASDFVSEGFVKELRARGIDADVVMPEAHFGYYEARDVDTRLETDIFAPARAQGYREIWIVGISLGGLGALLYSAQHAKDVTGILLIAPFPGSDRVLAEIRQAGGLRAWVDTPQAQAGDERPALRWFTSASALQQRRSTDAESAPAIFMGTGTSDRLIDGQRLLGAALPPARVRFVEGGHSWPTWRKVWRDFLDDGPWALEAAKQAHLDRIKL